MIFSFGERNNKRGEEIPQWIALVVVVTCDDDDGDDDDHENYFMSLNHIFSLMIKMKQKWWILGSQRPGPQWKLFPLISHSQLR